MKTKNLRTPSNIGLIIMAAIVISLSGCATKKAAWGSMKKGMIMQYRLHPDQNLKYATNQDFKMNMEVMEQKFEITSKSEQLFSMMPLVSKNKNLEYVVTVDEMSSVMNTPRGEMIANMENVVGESFNLSISRLGAELDYSKAADIVYDYGTGEKRSIASDIQTFFPNLPDGPIMQGDSWPSVDTITEAFEESFMQMAFDNINTFEGLEHMNGYDCMKISTVFTGLFEGEGRQDDMDLITTGTMEGSSVWYFAYKEGLYISQEVSGKSETTTVVKGPQEMSIPSTRNYSIITQLK